MKKKIAVMAGGWNMEVLYQIIKGIQRRAMEDSADVFVFNCYGGITKDSLYNVGEYNIFALPVMEEFDGFLMASCNLASADVRNNLKERFLALGKPAVSIEHDINGLHYVGMDNYAAMCEIVEHLIVCHHCKTFNYIGGPSKNYENAERKRAFIDVLQKYNIPIEPERIKDYNFLYEDGVEAFRYFKSHQMECPDAVVCANDEMAVGYNIEATRHGLSAPYDFLITGFDNFEYASVYEPKLTTVDREKESAGYISCDVLLRLIGGEGIPHTTRLQHKEIFTESCGCSTQFKHSINVGVQKSMNKTLLDVALDLQLTRFETELVGSDDFSEFNQHLAEYMEITGCKSFYLLLNTKEDGSPERRGRQISDMGYSDTMYINFAWKNGKSVEYSKSQLLTKLLLPNRKAEDSEGHTYIFSPLHLKGKNFGYCVMEDGFDLIKKRVLFRWLNIINIALEVTPNKQDILNLSEELKDMYMRDSLTGLYNRYGYEQLAADYFRMNENNHVTSMIMFIDLDGLKVINDFYGHEHGDLAIRTVANTLKHLFLEESIVIRYGGDEFVIVAACDSEKFAEAKKQEILRHLEMTSKKSLLPYQISASVGYVITEEDSGKSLAAYIKEADAIMYQDKEKFHKRR